MDKNEVPCIADFDGTIRWGEPGATTSTDECTSHMPPTSAEDAEWAHELLRRLGAKKSPA